MNSLEISKLWEVTKIASSGQIPSCVGQLPELLVLDLSWNQLTGKIPRLAWPICICDIWTSKEIIFQDRYPKTWVNCDNCTTWLLDGLVNFLINSQLSGMVLSYYRNKVELHGALLQILSGSKWILGFNFFETIFAISSSFIFFHLVCLFVCAHGFSRRLSHNRLEGELPLELGALEKLRYLYLNDNKIHANMLTERCHFCCRSCN